MNLSELRERAESPLSTGKMKLKQEVVLSLLDRIEAAERQLAERDAQIAVLADIVDRVSRMASDCECSCDSECCAPHDIVKECRAALTPDLVSLAADYRDALAVRERVMDMNSLAILLLRNSYSGGIEAEPFQQALLGKGAA